MSHYVRISSVDGVLSSEPAIGGVSYAGVDPYHPIAQCLVAERIWTGHLTRPILPDTTRPTLFAVIAQVGTPANFQEWPLDVR